MPIVRLGTATVLGVKILIRLANGQTVNFSLRNDHYHNEKNEKAQLYSFGYVYRSIKFHRYLT